MTIKQLREKLNEFDDDNDICIHLGCGITANIDYILQDDNDVVYIDFFTQDAVDINDD